MPSTTYEYTLANGVKVYAIQGGPALPLADGSKKLPADIQPGDNLRWLADAPPSAVQAPIVTGSVD
jgi:hypothetical protein